MRRPILRLVAALCIIGGATVAVGLPAGGQTGEESSFAPPEAFMVQYGWWNKAQQIPTTSPVPKPPNAPDDGLYIAYETTSANAPTAVTGPIDSGAVPGTPADDAPVVADQPPPEQQVLHPTAYSAVRYEAPEGAEGRLTLTLNDRSASTPAGTDPLVGEVLACLATSPWDPVQNGRFDGAPTYDCSAAASVTIAGDQLVFELPSGLQVGRVFDLVLVPVGTEPYTMSIARPEDASFVITNPEDLLPAFEESEFEPYEPPVTESGETFFVPEDTFTFEPPPVEAPAPTVQLVTPTRRNEVAQPLPNPFAKDASRAERIAAVALLLLLATGLWWFGGQEARPPRLLGSLGARQAALVPAGQAPRSAPTGGIGRFARPRLGTAPRL